MTFCSFCQRSIPTLLSVLFLLIIDISSLRLPSLNGSIRKEHFIDSAKAEPTIITIDLNQNVVHGTICTTMEEDNNNDVSIHNTLMGIALEQAKKAANIGEVPIGAIVVQEIHPNSANTTIPQELRQSQNHEVVHEETITNTTTTTTKNSKIINSTATKFQRHFQILSYGHNQIETNHDASAHAELQALRSASAYLQNWRLLHTTLYSTLEPCPMCLSACQAFRIERVVYGAPDLRLGAIETQVNLLEMFTHPFHDGMDVVGGIRREECADVLKDFFRERRKMSKKKKKKDSKHKQTPIVNNNEDRSYSQETVTRPRLFRPRIQKIVGYIKNKKHSMQSFRIKNNDTNL